MHREGCQYGTQQASDIQSQTNTFPYEYSLCRRYKRKEYLMREICIENVDFLFKTDQNMITYLLFDAV